MKKGWTLRWLDCTLYIVPALLSLVGIFLWFCSAHYCTKWNFNLLWTSPLFLYLAPASLLHFRRSKYSQIHSKIYRVVAFIQIAFLLTLIGMIATGWPQHFNNAILPIALTLFTRLVARLYIGKVKVEE